MVAQNFQTQNQSWRQLMTNGNTFDVPRFQRDYSWGEDQWDDLWQDLMALEVEEEPAHYMGYLVLQTSDNKGFHVVDGQQRLTTLSLLALAVVKCLAELVQNGVDPEDNTRRIEQLRGAFIGFLDPVTLVARNKLTLNRHNDALYKDKLAPLDKLPKRNLRQSERLLIRAFEWLTEKVRERHLDGRQLASFLMAIADKTFFTAIIVSDELNAFKVFETLNARGVKLSPTDLLKNYLFSVVHREQPHGSEIDDLERRWDRMSSQLEDEHFTDFLRAHWNSRHAFVRETDLFKRIRSTIKSRAAVFELIRAMEDDIECYVALSDPGSELWSPDERSPIAELRMFNVRQQRPLLLAARRAFPSSFGKVLHACSILAFRYNVIGGLATGPQESVYNEAARAIATNKVGRAEHVVRDLKPIYVGDAEFEQAFSSKRLKTGDGRNKRVVRYILSRMETDQTGVALDLDAADTTLEHILPENPGGEWSAFNAARYEDNVYRIGNMCLLERTLNKSLGSSGFDAKKPGYAKSGFVTTQRVAEQNDEWLPERVTTRQSQMAKVAVRLWSLPQLTT